MNSVETNNYSIAIVVKEFPPDKIGGAETQTQHMAEELQTRGHQVTVFTKSYGTHTDDNSYDIIRIPNLRINSFLSDLTFVIFCLLSLLRRRNFDCIQCMMIHPIGGLGYIVNRLTRIPYFAWIRGNDFYVNRKVGWRRRVIKTVLSDTIVVVQAPQIADDVQGEFPSTEMDLRVIGNGISVPDEIISPDTHTILFVGRLVPKKGVEYLINALSYVEMGNVQLIIVGDGPERDRLEQLAEDFGDLVSFEGFVHPDGVDQYFKYSSMLVLPSTEGEGMPNVVLEAMAWGLPVISTDSGGIPSLIRDGETGFIVPMRDSRAIAGRINVLLTNPSLRSDVGIAAREYVQTEHNWDRILKKLDMVYIDLVKE